jgi:hypothetical protein
VLAPGAACMAPGAEQADNHAKPHDGTPTKPAAC